MKQRNFKEIYDSIYSNVGEQVEIKRKSTLRISIVAFLIAVVIWVTLILSFGKLFFPIIIFGVIFTIVLLMSIVSKLEKNYQKLYKEVIIKEIVKGSNPKLKYLSNSGVGSKEYATGRI